MFTGIIEQIGTLISAKKKGGNLELIIASPLSSTLKIDQSVSHNGICLTVIACDAQCHTVVAVKETISKTNMSTWQLHSAINLERCMVLGARLDGHLVQGHVDTTAACISKEDQDGSWYFRFKFEPSAQRILVDKGSICVNGVSLTVIEPTRSEFGVAIIPYTLEHTNFKDLEVGQYVNLEFDIIGKYMTKFAELYR